MKRLLIGWALALAASSNTAAGDDFQLKDGDRVVWLGSTLIEREQRYGYWEEALGKQWPDRKITHRNLGWSGDNVWGEARLGFELNRPEVGLQRMVDLTLAEKPSVIFICYGANESFEGDPGLEKFEKGLERLLDGLAPAKARIVLVTPPPFEQKPAPLPDMSEAERRLEKYRKVVARVAERRELRLADFAEQLRVVMTSRPDLTDNGVHLTERGYYLAAPAFLAALGVSDIAAQPSYAEDPQSMSDLRRAIVEKNRLYFYRWRPENETYLFGFRKHEQGRNAREIAEFDPLIAQAEEKIEQLKKAAVKK